MTDPTIFFQTELDAFEQALKARLNTRMGAPERRVVVMGKDVSGEKVLNVPPAEALHSASEVYFTEVDGSGFGQATCDERSPRRRLGRRVWVGYRPNEPGLHVLSAADVLPIGLSPTSNTSGVSAHGRQHGLLGIKPDGGQEWVGTVGEDPVLVHPLQVAALSVLPDEAMTPALIGGWCNFAGDMLWVDTQSLMDLTDYVPDRSGYARYVLVEVNVDGDIVYTFGPTFINRLFTGTRASKLPAPDGNRVQCAAILLVADMTVVTYAHIWPMQVQTAVRLTSLWQYVDEMTDDLWEALSASTSTTSSGVWQQQETITTAVTVASDYQASWYTGFNISTGGSLTVNGSVYVRS